MADNELTGTGKAVATDKVTYSGDADQNIQLCRMVGVTGSEGSKTVIDPPLNFNGTATTATWTSATSANTEIAVSTVGYTGALLYISGDGAGISAGRIVFQPSYDSASTYADSATAIDVGAYQGSAISLLNLINIQGSKSSFYIPALGATNIKVRLSIAITGSETLSLRLYATTVEGLELNTLAAARDVTVTGITAALAGGDNNIGNMDIASVPAPLNTQGGGTEATALRVTIATDSTGVLSVDDNGSSLTVDNATISVVGSGTEATAQRVTIATDSTGLLSVDDNGGSLTVDGTVAAAGTVAHDGNTANNPVTVGGRAIAHGTNPTAVAAGDVTDGYYNRAGVKFVIGGHPNVVTIKHTTITTAVTDAAIVTISTGLKIVVTRISVTLDNASTVFPTLLIGFGTANTPTTTGVLIAHGGVPAGGGITVGDGSGILGIGADNEDLRVTTTGNATGNGLQIVVSYFTIET